MLDRTIAPGFNPIKSVTIPPIDSAELTNGRKIYFRQDNSIEVFKIELLIKSGSWYADKYPYLGLTLKMLNEGTVNKNAHQLAESIDYIGSFTEFSPGFDRSSVSFYGQSKFFVENLSLLSEILQKPAFEESPFESLKKKEIQKLELNLEKGSYLSSIAQRSALFGEDHPYGKGNSAKAIANVDLEEIKAFFKSNFSDYDILISGNLPENFLSELENYFGKDEVTSVEKRAFSISVTNPQGSAIRKPAFIQSSLKVGKRLFNRTHPDYMKFIVANELLGGFFGSRLMKNIREEKGFTYGIYSHLYSLNEEGYFSIGTEVNGENEEETLTEIFKEIRHLQEVPVGIDELNTVKNYMAGSFAGSINSPFAVMEKFKAIHYMGMDMGFYDGYLDAVNAVSPEDIATMIGQYLQPESMITCLAGPEK